MRLVKLLNGEVLAIQIMRLVIYLDSPRWNGLRFGGIMVDYKGKRLVARHITGRFSFITDDQIETLKIKSKAAK